MGTRTDSDKVSSLNPSATSRSQRVSSPRGQKFVQAPAFNPLSTSLGNQAMLSLLQSGQIHAKLRVSQPGDHDEIESASSRSEHEPALVDDRSRIRRRCRDGGDWPAS